MSYCDILFTTLNISYNLQLPMIEIARLSNFLTTDLLTYLLTYLLTLAIPRGAFAPKSILNPLHKPMLNWVNNMKNAVPQKINST